MRVLLSAYACEPYKGSEPAVGWNWLLESAKTENNIWLITRKNNQAVITQYFNEHKQPENVNFIYYDLPSKLMFLKKYFGIYLYYLLWQIGAYITVRTLHKNDNFEQVHHITFATIRQPSFMGLLGIPFIYGPAGGGESPPWHLIKNFPWQPKWKEILRIVANVWVKFDPFMHFTFITADKIVVTSEQTKELVPYFYHEKIVVKLAIAQTNMSAVPQKDKQLNNTIKLLFVGRFEYWKGVHLCIRSLVELKSNVGQLAIKLTLIGEGPFKKQLQMLANELGVDHMIEWHSWMEQEKLTEFYSSHHVFVFPSLHDSGGMVVLEALAESMPVVCLDLGGPSTIVTPSSGAIIDADLSEEVICQQIAKHISLIVKDENYQHYCQHAKMRSQQLTWEKLVMSLL